MNAHRMFRLAFVCDTCEKLHEIEGGFQQVALWSQQLMLDPAIGGFVVSDATAATIVDQDAFAQAKLREKALCKSLNDVIKDALNL
jgi:hypothetical protein